MSPASVILCEVYIRNVPAALLRQIPYQSVRHFRQLCICPSDNAEVRVFAVNRRIDNFGIFRIRIVCKNGNGLAVGGLFQVVCGTDITGQQMISVAAAVVDAESGAVTFQLFSDAVFYVRADNVGFVIVAHKPGVIVPDRHQHGKILSVMLHSDVCKQRSLP